MSRKNARTEKFDCWIVDKHEELTFSAGVTVSRFERPLASKHDAGEFEHADIFIVYLSHRIGGRGVTFTQDRQTGEVVAEEHDHLPPNHDHFILFDLNGRGKYLYRNEFHKTVGERLCTIWDFGNDFGTGVAAAMRKMGPWGTGQ
ncbi:MAG TPA: hypothetical protein VH436_35660 [Vicinamibacterales bacterium]|jgi:hypothetical protein